MPAPRALFAFLLTLPPFPVTTAVSAQETSLEVLQFLPPGSNGLENS